MKMILKAMFIGLGFSIVSASGALAQSNVLELAQMSLEQLLNTTVTSVAGRPQNLNDVANAMYVISKEDIERSGARQVADLFYRVPGLQTRQIDGHQYGIGIREGGSYTTNNILVLIDGAVVFNPLINGTIWENLPVSLNEIERIEIIRGSPGVLYSSNAVRGVINIITKRADIQDNYVIQRGGSQSFRNSAIGVGGKIGTLPFALRAYLNNQFSQGFVKGWNVPRSSDRYLAHWDGGRLDYTPSEDQRLSVIVNDMQQNSTRSNVGVHPPPTSPGQTVTAIVNFIDKVTDKYDLSLHVDQVEQLATSFVKKDAIVHTTSISTQHNFHYDLLGRHVSSLGGEWRYNRINTDVDDGLHGLVSPGNNHARQTVISFFLQDEWRPIEPLILTAGLREDTNTFIIHHTPLYSPKISALYHLTENQSVWASSSRTYRTPSVLERYLSIYGGAIVGSTSLKPEVDYTQEIGYRSLWFDKRLKAETTVFLTHVGDVIVRDSTTGLTANNGSLKQYGAELALDYQCTDHLSFSTDYSYVYPHLKPETGNDTDTRTYDTLASNNIIGLGTRYTFNKIKLDFYAKYFEGYIYAGTKVRGYYKSFIRFSYDFKTPAWAGKLNGTYFLEVNDALGARKVEDVQFFTSFIKPTVTSGIKVRF